MYYYIFKVRAEGYVVYDRTLNTLEQAEHRIKELNARKIQAVWTNFPIKGFYY